MHQIVKAKPKNKTVRKKYTKLKLPPRKQLALLLPGHNEEMIIAMTIQSAVAAGQDLEDIFVHYTAIKQDGYKTLSEGQIVEFNLIKTDKGLQATNVKTVNEKELTTIS